MLQRKTPFGGKKDDLLGKAIIAKVAGVQKIEKANVFSKVKGNKLELVHYHISDT